jgi:hypothetical protein
VGAQLALEYGEALSLDLFQRESGVGREVVRRLFGRWSELRRLLGLSDSAPPRVCRPRGPGGEEMVASLKAVATAEGGEVSERRFFEVTGWTRAQVRTRFGSWTELRRAAGLGVRVHRAPRYTQEMMLEDLFEVWLRTGKFPDFRRHEARGGRIRAKTIRERFGNWEKVRAAFEGYLQAELRRAVGSGQ